MTKEKKRYTNFLVCSDCAGAVNFIYLRNGVIVLIRLSPVGCVHSFAHCEHFVSLVCNFQPLVFNVGGACISMSYLTLFVDYLAI